MISSARAQTTHAMHTHPNTHTHISHAPIQVSHILGRLDNPWVRGLGDGSVASPFRHEGFDNGHSGITAESEFHRPLTSARPQFLAQALAWVCGVSRGFMF